ncbi:serine/threonine-protein phosphatase 2A regulatory subunit B'' subunit beta isoform X2 [Microcaecilia unicolor]|uniref:Serine/threonine-protein phosphatase 2A regulatory subunit B'' subunit beta-like isoform X2 n=1 Tax=Microcaecilia unicolor TaxID=1415580 RepID=A0A6P7Y3Q8_9AMPH|nr:serine/threonine-protein phosphatase 2A regulatory subunit B'' subunit beta-like isoform X2 [Microcaecilia unicolor]
MPAGKILQPVLKMKVDELFLCWLSETPTQLLLKDYLRRIKNGEKINIGDCDDKESLSANKHNLYASQSVLDNLPVSPLTPCSPSSQLTSNLPLSPLSSPRTGLNARVRRSTGVKTVQQKKEEPLKPALSQTIPKFYFPRGCPAANMNIDTIIEKIEKTFCQFPNERVTLEDMGKVAKACDCPLYWKAPLFYAAGGERTGYVSVHKFVAMWRKVLQNCFDDSSKFICLLMKPGSNCLEQEDFIPFLQDVVNTNPHLTFLKEASEFHSRYITTVIQRIFYTVNRSWSGKITCTELRKSSFLQTVALLEEDDINQLDYFSYEHFYVIYCKFWELDTDHDLYIDQKDLARHNDHAISNRMIERIFSGCVTRGRKAQKEGKIGYDDFVWFLISEEDKKTTTSIEYWFRCMDLDGDGVLSMYELEYFYEEQCQKMENMAIEPLPFEDCLCQMLDLVKPHCVGKITLRDLKNCKQANVFFDTFFNLEKYLDHEQKDPFSILKIGERESQDISDWEKYAAEEYDILVAEDSAGDQWNDGCDAELNALDNQMANEVQFATDKRPFFEVPSHQLNMVLDDYEYEEDFE